MIDFSTETLIAAEARVLDTNLQLPRGISPRDIASSFIFDTVVDGLVVLLPPEMESILSSREEDSYLKNIKFQIHAQNLKCIKLSNEIGKSVKTSFADIKEFQKELSSLSSEVKEQEFRLIQNFSKVHFNNFNRGIDAQIGWNDRRFLKDYKTGFSFMEKHLMTAHQGLGLTLPAKEIVEIPISEVSIVHELTNSGDTLRPLKVSDPQNLVRKNKAFFYTIAKKESDTTSRKYKERTSIADFPHSGEPILTIELHFSTVVQINYLSFEPLGNAGVRILNNSIQYRDRYGAYKEVLELTQFELASYPMQL